MYTILGIEILTTGKTTLGTLVNPSETTFIRRISAVSNAVQTIDNEANHLIICCLNCIRHGRNATYERALTERK